MLNQIKKARLIKGITQKQVAEMLGVSNVTVCKWEHGKMFPSVKRLKSVAALLGTTVEELLTDEREVM